MISKINKTHISQSMKLENVSVFNLTIMQYVSSFLDAKPVAIFLRILFLMSILTSDTSVFFFLLLYAMFCHQFQLKSRLWLWKNCSCDGSYVYYYYYCYYLIKVTIFIAKSPIKANWNTNSIKIYILSFR